MANQAGTIERVALALGRALAPLEAKLSAGNVLTLFAEMGVQFPPALIAQPAFAAALRDASRAAGALPSALSSLASAIATDDTGQILARGAELIVAIVALTKALKDVGTQLSAAAGTVPGIPAQVVSDFAADLAPKLVDYMVVSALESAQPEAARILPWTGLVDRVPRPGDENDATRPPFIERRLRLDRVGRLLQDPAQLAQDLTGWGPSGVDVARLLRKLDELLRQTGVATTLTPAPPALPTSLGTAAFTLTPNPAPPSLAVEIAMAVPGGLDFPVRVSDAWMLRFGLTAAMDTGLRITITPPGSFSFQPPAGTLTGEARFEAIGERSAAEAFVLIGQTGGGGLRVRRVRLALVLSFSTGSAVEPIFEGEIAGGQAVIDLSDGDGFIQSVTGGARLEANLELKARWSPKSGLRIEGSSSIEFAIPCHISIGPVEITTIYVIVGIASDGSLPAELSGALSAKLGPLQASVDRIGLLVKTTFPAGGGNLGPANLEFAFKPPNGIGLAVDAGVIKGGGYLYIDADRGEYAGALELVIADFVSLTAIGLITTKNPDGTPGFSLLIIITAEFGSGIQLGYGFTLLAVGGLLGVNRTMKLQALMEGVRTGAIDGVMFPHDVIANAPKIISDLRALFPPQSGIFLVGPMAKLGWGTPTLVSISLGIIIEIPGNIAILGVLKIVLPTEDAALVRLQVNFAGAIEFDKKRIYFFAALFESRIVFLTIEAEMGLLVAFGDDANFVVSVGGFHPRFTPPPLPFPSPRRIAVSLINTDVARVRIEGYLAVTSNTVQFGARAELFFGLDEFNVQGELAFDALFQFSPFHFIIEISASFSVKVFGIGLFSVHLHGSLEGPARWRAHGTASISLLFFDISVDVDVSWGESADTQLPPIQVMPLFKAELEKAESWRALLPQGNSLRVSLRKFPDDDAQVLHPVGVLRVAQRRMPLELKLDKLGNQRPTDVNRLSLRVVSGGLAKRADALEQFAPAQFQDMSDGEKLSRPAFVPDRGGLELSAAGDALRSSRMVKRVVRYELIILDSNFKRFVRRFYVFTARLFDFFLRGSSAARSPLSQAMKTKLQPFEERIAVKAETYSVAFQRDNTPAAAEAETFTSEASARDWLDRKVASDPSLADTLHVIPSHERAA